jgi:GT2 family glycosyltransferase
VTVIRNRVNQGWAAGLNQGLEHSRAPYLFFCNNDTEVYPNAVEEMLSLAQKRDEFGLINPNSNEFGMKAFDRDELARLRGQWVERLHASGFFVLVKRKVADAIGGIDLAYSPGYFEDMDYSERAKRAGFLSVMARGAYVYHFGTRSFLPKEKESLWQRHRAIFDERWGGAKWFVYLGDDRTLLSPEKRAATIARLLKIIRRESAICYAYVPRGTGKYFETLHMGFRPVEAPEGLRSFICLGKLLFRSRKKPVSKIIVETERIRKVWEPLKFLHRADVLLIDYFQWCKNDAG